MARREDDRIAYLAGEDAASLSAAERAELDDVRSLLRSPATWAQPDPGLEDRIVTAIADQAAEQSAGTRTRRVRPRLRLLRPAYAGPALAAVAAATIAVALFVGGSSPTPGQFAMVVSGSALAPNAHGAATLTKTGSGWRITLSARGLPHLANGRYYEAWLKSPAGVLVPVGTFNDARQVTLWAGVPPTQFPSLTVTRQQATGGPASSGQRVLSGTIGAAR